MRPERTLVEVLRARADAEGDRVAFTFLADGEREAARWSCAELDRRARAIGAHLQARLAAGDRVVLAYPPGLDFIAAFFGCLYAGMIAVPMPMPNPRRPGERLSAVAEDCRPAMQLGPDSPFPLDEADAWRAPALSGEAIAFLQYTSGSTARPKGVRVTHANLLANLAMIQAAEANDPASRGLSWLPAYHDMGLIEGILQPLYAGFPAWLMPPAAFLQRPLRWLQAISRLRITVSGAPDFAYALCTRRVPDEELDALDLAAWSVAYDGSEPINGRTLAAFARRFAACGFRESSLRPVYGLAEATLLVSASPPDRAAPRVLDLDAAALAEGRLRLASADDMTPVTAVSCGAAAGATRVSIDAHEGCVGEILVSGPAVTPGYWGHEDSRAPLRTGDLGFLHEGELYVTGRLKDLVILRGRKHYPQDIERSIEACHPAVRAAVAFAVQEEHVDRLVVLAEVERAAGADWPAVLDAIADATFRRHECAIAATVLVRRGTLPRTSSGKLMRFRCREQFLAADLHEIARADVRAKEDQWAA
jgi:acyl-CoA synthetase (AMP-forming)/AMP-acid ligase II